MADLVLKNSQSIEQDIKFRYKDMGDGTHALVGASVPAISTGSALDFAHVEKIITTVSQTVVPANANRKYLLFINDSDTVIYLNLAGVAAANSGVRLNANGGSYEMTTGAGNVSTAAITAIHGGAGDKLLIVTEGI